jgi:hypothetical protein
MIFQTSGRWASVMSPGSAAKINSRKTSLPTVRSNEPRAAHAISNLSGPSPNLHRHNPGMAATVLRRPHGGTASRQTASLVKTVRIKILQPVVTPSILHVHFIHSWAKVPMLSTLGESMRKPLYSLSL